MDKPRAQKEQSTYFWMRSWCGLVGTSIALFGISVCLFPATLFAPLGLNLTPYESIVPALAEIRAYYAGTGLLCGCLAYQGAFGDPTDIRRSLWMLFVLLGGFSLARLVSSATDGYANNILATAVWSLEIAGTLITLACLAAMHSKKLKLDS
tara:strand:- start:416 stop:871 length:456 start_codon:yes stop_codon:yes gene_type:complete